MAQRKVHLIESGQLGLIIHNRYDLHFREAYSSLKAAKKAVEYELEVNGAKFIQREAYRIGSWDYLQVSYSWYTKEGKEVRQRTVIRSTELR